MLYCRDCGKENPDDAKFCCNCGALLTLQPTQGTGLRSLPEIHPENVEEIEDVPDITGVTMLPKEEIKLELPDKIEAEPVVPLETEKTKEDAEPAGPKEADIDDNKKEFIELDEPTEKKFPWLAVIICLLVLLLIIFLVIKFKK